MTELLSIGIALIAGLMMTRLFKMLHLDFPDVTAFLIAGLLIGPYCLGLINVPGIGFRSYEEVEAVGVISTIALGFIAFAIGNEFRLEELREIGRQAFIVGVFQAVVASLVVDIVLVALVFILGEEVISIPAAITLGAIASATAPAATLMVVRQYKAKGKITTILLPIVALDDAVGLVIFAISFGIAQAMKAGNVSVLDIIAEPLIEIAASLILGAIMGWLLTQLEKLFYSNSNRLSLAIGFVVLTIAFAGLSFDIGPVNVHFSSLLVCMMLGTTFCNLCDRSADIMDRTDKWTKPVFALFFVLSGAELELSVFTSIAVVGIGIAYILSRSFGKYWGARISSKFAGCDETTQKYLGITLLPQAGVALGMCVTAGALGGYDAVLIRNIVLFGVLIYELIGPKLTLMALRSAGEVEPASEDTKSHKRHEKA